MLVLIAVRYLLVLFFFFFNDTATTEIYTLSLHDALPILLKQSIAFFTATRCGDVMSRLSNDVNGVQSVVSDTIFSLVNNVVILGSTVVLMFALDWKLTVAALLVLPAFLLPTRQVGKATFQARKATQGKLSEMTAYMQETLGISGMQLV